jgi:hypothetical protein
MVVGDYSSATRQIGIDRLRRAGKTVKKQRKNGGGRRGPALSIGHSRVHKKEQQQSDRNQDHPHNRPNNQTGHIGKGVGSMIAYYEYLSGYAQDYR